MRNTHFLSLENIPCYLSLFSGTELLYTELSFEAGESKAQGERMPILLADIQDILGAIVPVLFVVFWVVSQVIGGINKARKGQGPPPQEEPKRANPPSTTEDELAKEIERFLGKKTDADRTEKKIPKPNATESVVRADVIQTPVAAEAQSTPPQSDLSRKISQRKQWDPSRQSSGSVQPGGKKHKAVQNSPAFPPASAVDTTGQHQNNADAVIDLSTDHAAEADEMQTLMANPATLRQAFILSQIFSRPEDRW